MIERNGVVGSLRTLSMSEQRCWQLLFATAMIRILPNNMLVDTIILDELESNMDEHNRKLYTTEFLPYLQTLVSKVIVISPLIRGELSMQPDRAFLVEKKNKVSSLRQL
jgi:DNA repair exonuclease SbcCD ATPase subunit